MPATLGRVKVGDVLLIETIFLKFFRILFSPWLKIGLTPQNFLKPLFKLSLPHARRIDYAWPPTSDPRRAPHCESVAGAVMTA